nr:hypothetical protein [Tanacetum cinerariifolium]
MKVKKRRRDKFNLKERVSSLKYSLGLRERVFGIKMHLAFEFRDNDRSFVKDFMNGPTIMMNFVDRPIRILFLLYFQDNAIEVPLSPTSMCSSIHEDFYRAAYCASPTTPSALTSDDNDLPQAFRDISSNLSELRKQSNQLETDRSEESITKEQPFEYDMEEESEDEDEAYIQDFLIASGLYDNSFNKSLSRFNTYAKPINNSFYFFDMMVVRDLHSMPWLELVNDDVNALAKEVECQIMRDLIIETQGSARGIRQGNTNGKGMVINMVWSKGGCGKCKFWTDGDEDLMNALLTFPPMLADDVSDEPLIIEAELEGYLVRRVFLDQGAAVQVMFEHCIDNLPSSVKARLTPTHKKLVGFSEYQLIPIGKIELEIIFGTEGLCQRTIMKFMMLQLINLLKNNMDVFAWQPADMTRVPNHIIRHTLNVNVSVSPVAQKQRVLGAEKSKAIMKENITKENKDDYRWTKDAERAFQEMKKLILELPTLTTPMVKEVLYVYLATSQDVVSSVLLAERRGKQTPILYVSQTLYDAKRNYAPLEKLALCLLHLSQRLRRYFEAYPIKVITDQAIKLILNKPEVLENFINEIPVGDKHLEICSLTDEGTNMEEWTLYTDGVSSLKGVGAGLVLIDPNSTKDEGTNIEGKSGLTIGSLPIEL